MRAGGVADEHDAARVATEAAHAPTVVLLVAPSPEDPLERGADVVRLVGHGGRVWVPSVARHDRHAPQLVAQPLPREAEQLLAPVAPRASVHEHYHRATPRLPPPADLHVSSSSSSSSCS